MKVEVWIAIGALITSVASIYVAYKAIKIQKNHNIKSVKPIGMISLGDYENDLFVRIENKGIGPLIIKSVTATNGTITTKSLIDLVSSELSGSKITWSDFIIKLENRAIQPGDQLYLIRKTYKDLNIDNSAEKLKIRKALKNINLEMSYSDIYESKPEKCKEELTWFGRHFNN